MTTIALTGSTGRVGGAVARLLAAEGMPLRLLVRDPRRAPALPGTEVVRAEHEGTGTAEALRGVETLLMVSAHPSADRVRVHGALVDAAAAAGVEHVVYTSFVGAGDAAGFLLGRDHGATEEIIRRSGLEHTFLRNSFYAEVFPEFADGTGAIRGPAGQGRVAAVSWRDVAAVAAQVLRDAAAHRGRSYDLTGPRALTVDEIAGELTRVTRRPHRFIDETMEEAQRSRAGYGAPQWLVDAWISTYTAIRDGELEQVSEDVPRLLGRPATSFPEAIQGLDPH